MIERVRRASLVCHKASESDRAAIIAGKEIGKEEERKRERSRLVERKDRERERESSRSKETARYRVGRRDREQIRALAASIQQAPATLNSVGLGRTGRVCVRGPVRSDRESERGTRDSQSGRVYESVWYRRRDTG